MKTIQKLVNAKNDMKVGNHRVEFSLVGKERRYFYYNTVICSVDHNKGTFKIDASYGSVSTTRACNAYRKYFESLWYREEK